ncbi:Detected protein of unknown function [Hibiscus syriacus]|uniref:WAT1-related protein n=1 Tax=Hibiscus syriacus TaxID=106335 RepID=A0A6A2WJV4_HIBSY|nr:Detected protein of unknown function [Hibiscus syriacus]
MAMVELSKAKPYLAMISLQFGFAGMYVITMVSLQHGMNHYILAVYRHLVATIVIAPFALVLERKIRPKLTLPIFLRILVLGFLDGGPKSVLPGDERHDSNTCIGHCQCDSCNYLRMALIFRLERVNIKKVRSIAKIIGTLIMVPGAIIMTLYKGPAINFIKLQGGSHHTATMKPRPSIGLPGHHALSQMLGMVRFLLIYIELYPANLSLTAMICLIGTIGGAAVSFAMERDMSAWKIGEWCVLVSRYAQGVVLREQGPVLLLPQSPLHDHCGTFFVHLGSIWAKQRPEELNHNRRKSEAQELPITDGF